MRRRVLSPNDGLPDTSSTGERDVSRLLEGLVLRKYSLSYLSFRQGSVLGETIKCPIEIEVV